MQIARLDGAAITGRVVPTDDVARLLGDGDVDGDPAELGIGPALQDVLVRVGPHRPAPTLVEQPVVDGAVRSALHHPLRDVLSLTLGLVEQSHDVLLKHSMKPVIGTISPKNVIVKLCRHLQGREY